MSARRRRRIVDGCERSAAGRRQLGDATFWSCRSVSSKFASGAQGTMGGASHDAGCACFCSIPIAFTVASAFAHDLFFVTESRHGNAASLLAATRSLQHRMSCSHPGPCGGHTGASSTVIPMPPRACLPLPSPTTAVLSQVSISRTSAVPAWLFGRVGFGAALSVGVVASCASAASGPVSAADEFAAGACACLPPLPPHALHATTEKTTAIEMRNPLIPS